MSPKIAATNIKEEIIDAARSLFLNDGYSHVSMRKIASKIGYTPTTIYIYFKNKEEILLTLLEEGYELFFASIKEAYDTNLPNEERLFKMCEAYIHFGLKYSDYYNLIFTENLETNIRSIENSNRFNGFLLLNTVVKDLIEDNTFAINMRELEASDLYISNSLWASLHGLTALLITFPQFNWAERSQLIHMHIRSMILGIKMFHR